MRNMIERYVYDVTRRLPENQREEVEKELHANINDMLGERPSEEDVKNVLTSLGHPRRLANNYREKQRYLISPEWMDDYLMVLKIVLIVLGSIAFVGGLIGNLLNPEETTVIGIIAEVFAKTLSDIFNALLSGFAIVTLIFYLIGRSHEKREDEFDVRKLPDLPKEKENEIKVAKSITGLIFETIFGALFIYLLATGKFNAVWFDENLQLTAQYAIFNQGIVDNYIPIFIICFIVTVFADVFKLFKTHWDFQLFGVYAFAKVLSAIVAVAFLTSSGLLNVTLFDYLSNDVLGVEAMNMMNGVYIAFKVISAFIIVGTVADL
ncbi:MAG TPA: hypothetical protein PKU69_04500, partial [Bacillota bacterium]|nr:hypothetical protein [Bacillota bacterium]